jgi:hypothetical protein
MAKRKRRPGPLLYYSIGIAAITAIVALIILVPRLYPQYRSGDRFRYNYFEFELRDGTYYTTVQGGKQLYQVSLRNSPRDLEDIPVRGNISSFGSLGRFAITFDANDSVHTPSVTMANAEISPNLVRQFGADIMIGCVRPDPKCENVSIITCANSTRPVIFLNNMGNASIDIVGKCAVISGRDAELIRAADRFMYGMYGIMR